MSVSLKGFATISLLSQRGKNVKKNYYRPTCCIIMWSLYSQISALVPASKSSKTKVSYMGYKRSCLLISTSWSIVRSLEDSAVILDRHHLRRNVKVVGDPSQSNMFTKMDFQIKPSKLLLTALTSLTFQHRRKLLFEYNDKVFPHQKKLVRLCPD